MPRPVCLIGEAEILIGIDVETFLDGLGIAVAGPFARGADALAWAATNRADVAILDYMLQEGACLPLIRALQEQQVPIVIHSGWLSYEADVPPEVSGLPWDSKPMDYNTLLKVLAEAAPQIFLPDSVDRPDAIVQSANGQQSIRVKSSGIPLTDILIKRLKSLAALSEAAVEAVADVVVRTYSVESRQDIVVAGSPRSECHVLLDGMAAPYKLLSDGKRQIVRFAFPGDFIDLDGYVGGTMDHSVAALGACTVGVIPQQALHDVARDRWDLRHGTLASHAGRCGGLPRVGGQCRAALRRGTYRASPLRGVLALARDRPGE